MSITFRVRAGALGGDEFICENYEAKSDAEAYFKELQSDTDNPLDSVPYASVWIALEEFCNGQWTTVSKKLVAIGE